MGNQCANSVTKQIPNYQYNQNFLFKFWEQSADWTMQYLKNVKIFFKFHNQTLSILSLNTTEMSSRINKKSRQIISSLAIYNYNVIHMAVIPTVQQTNITIAEFIMFNFDDMPIFSFYSIMLTNSYKLRT